MATMSPGYVMDIWQIKLFKSYSVALSNKTVILEESIYPNSLLPVIRLLVETVVWKHLTFAFILLLVS